MNNAGNEGLDPLLEAAGVQLAYERANHAPQADFERLLTDSDLTDYERWGARWMYYGYQVGERPAASPVRRSLVLELVRAAPRLRARDARGA